jgi:predicted KAP-like P-loop ATPase
MSLKTSVVDLPRQKGEEDLFSIDKYKNGLIQFVNNAETPITIALQGEWGSGKTSLMNSLQDELCGDLNYSDQETNLKDFYGVWINTWQYSLMSSREETLFFLHHNVNKY